MLETAGIVPEAEATAYSKHRSKAYKPKKKKPEPGLLEQRGM